MNCPLGFDLVSGMREGWGIQPPRRQERQGERGDVTVGHDLNGPGANQGRDPDPDFDCGVPALAREGLHWHQTGTVGLPILMGG